MLHQTLYLEKIPPERRTVPYIALMLTHALTRFSSVWQDCEKRNRDTPENWKLSEMAIPWLAVFSFLVISKWSMLADAYYWDELGCYFSQTWEMSHHLISFINSKPAYFRSPFYTGILAAFYHIIEPLVQSKLELSRIAVRSFMILFCSLAPVASYGLARQLGGSKSISWLACVFCMCVPLVFAQSSLVLMDLPAAGFCGLAFIFLLRRGLLGYVIFSTLAVLTKESTYYISIPAACLVYLRLVGRGERPFSWRILFRVLPALAPGITLFFWLLVHREITGSMIASDHKAVISVSSIPRSFYHNTIEGGRLMLSLCSFLFLRLVLKTWKTSGVKYCVDVWSVGLLWLLLPICFPAWLIRYLAPSLPPLCSLSALFIGTLQVRKQVTATILFIIGFGVFSGYGDTYFHDNPPFELEGNLQYRVLLDEHVKLAKRLSALGVISGVSEFPFSNMMNSPPAFGYLAQPIAFRNFRMTPEDLCAGDVVVVSAASAEKRAWAEKARTQGLLALWFVAAGDDFPLNRKSAFKFLNYDHRILVYRSVCKRK